MGAWVEEVMGMMEGTSEEHRVMLGNAKSLTCTPKTNSTLYVNWNLHKNKKIIKHIAYWKKKRKGISFSMPALVIVLLGVTTCHRLLSQIMGSFLMYYLNTVSLTCMH